MTPTPISPTPPKPDDLLLDVVRSAFGQGLSWYLVGFVVFTIAWFSFLKGATAAGRKARDATGRLYSSLRTRPAAHRLFVVVATALLMVLQCGWLFVAFMVGNMVSFAFGERTNPVVPLGFDNINITPGPPSFDNISTLYVVAAIALLVLAGIRETRDDERIVLMYGAIVGIPALYWGLPTGLVVLLDTASMLWTEGKEFLPPGIESPAIIAGTSGAYLTSCFAAIYCSVLLARLWRARISPTGGEVKPLRH